jgi:hypothetical protein
MYLHLQLHKQRQRELERLAKRERLVRETWQTRQPTRQPFRSLSRLAALFL